MDLRFFGLLELPELLGAGLELDRGPPFAAGELFALVAVHVANALYHHLIRRDGVL